VSSFYYYFSPFADELRRVALAAPTEMRGCLDGFREVLFNHLDQEVNDLKGENLRKYWTSLEELLEALPSI
jgi:hypothetical protein